MNISAITLTEALIRPHAVGDIHAAQATKRINDLIGKIIPIDSEIAALTAKIRASQKARISDSIIIATAIVSGCKLITFDRKMMGVYERVK